ncbi:MAG: choice-of-anchor D domain-containing protein [Cytophagaceae bacterium]|jgi:gliding motility-associated-like protein|nr:choice-of-anchor D domain-containing protein [Cytophagaceae bacterium]
MKRSIVGSFFILLVVFQQHLLGQNNSLHLDGLNDQVVCGDLDLSTYTIEAWVKTGIAGNYTICSKGNGNGFNGNYIFQIQNGYVSVQSDYSGTPMWFYSINRIADNVYTHVAVTFDDVANQMKFYINGVPEGVYTTPTGSPYQDNTSMYIGRQGFSCNCNFFLGQMDELRFWNRVLSCDEINQHKSCSLLGSESGLRAYYTFNQGTGGGNNAGLTTLLDASPNAFHGTILNFNLNGSTSNFLSDGAVVSGTCGSFTQPEIQVLGNSNPIQHQDMTPDANDHSHFGNYSGSPIVRTFTIQNTGSDLLSISSVTISGTHSDQFAVTTPPASTLAPAASTTFQITCTPLVSGMLHALVNIQSSDCDESPFQFKIGAGGFSPIGVLTTTYATTTVARFTNDGATSCPSFITTGSQPYGVVVDEINEKIYWINSGGNSIGRSNLDGSSVNNSFITGLSTPIGLEIDVRNNFLYWTSRGSKTIGRANLDGTGVTNAFVSIPSADPLSVQVDATEGYIYWTDYLSNRIGRCLLNGTFVNYNYITGVVGPHQFKLEPLSRQFYIAGYGSNTIVRVGVDGTGLTTLVTGCSQPNGVAIDVLNDKIYWANFATSQMGRSNLNGTSASQVFLPMSGPVHLCLGLIANPEINITGNTLSIADGAGTPSVTNHTDFGNVDVATGIVTRTFTIQNTGIGALRLNGSPRVVVTGTGFSLQTDAPALIPAGGSATFEVRFDPSAAGLATGTVALNTDDCDEDPYNFSIQGTGIALASALEFDGVNDYIGLGTAMSNVFGGADKKFTIEAWINGANFASATSWNVIFAKASGSICAQNGREFYFGVSPTGELQFLFYGQLSGTNYFIVNTNATIPINEWHHVAVSYDGSIDTSPLDRVTLLIDGMEQTTYVSASNGSLPFDIQVGPAHAGIGANLSNTGTACITPNQYWDGMMDEIRVWEDARSCDQIKANMNIQLSGTEPLLRAYYAFNQGVVNGTNTGETTLVDLAGNDDAGTLTGFALTGVASNWVDGTSNGVSGTIPQPLPEINVTGNAVSILSGDNSPSVTDHTSFGTLTPGSNLVRTFTIQNTGAAPLTISTIVSSGTQASLFTVAGVPASVPAGGSATFTVTFQALTTGTKSALITITSDDCDESGYTFLVQGNSVNPSPGNAFSFDGTNDFVDLDADISRLDFDAPATIEFWAKSNVDHKSGSPRPIFQIENGANQEFSVWWGNLTAGLTNERISVFHETANAAANQTIIGVTDPGTYVGEWHHYAVVCTGTQFLFYIDGELKSSTNSSAHSNPAPGRYGNGFVPTTARIANRPSLSNYFSGDIDELKIWNLIRTQAEIQAGMNAELAGTETGLISYYNFNQGLASGTNTNLATLVNKVAAGKCGIVSNATLIGTSSNWISADHNVPLISTMTAPEIEVRGNLLAIVNGDVTPSSTDHTDFGSVPVSSGSITRIFTIANLGDGTLNFSGSPVVAVTGAGFSLSLDAATSIAASGSTTFEITFDPSVAGTAGGTVSIGSDDCDEPVYTFSISGTGSQPATALHFDGASDLITLGNVHNTTIAGVDKKFTIEAWVNLSNLNTNSKIIASKQANSNCTQDQRQFSFAVQTSGRLSFAYFGSLTPTIFANVQSDGVLTINQWYHVAVTYDGSIDSDRLDRVTFYIDGVKQNNSLITSGGSFPFDIPSGTSHFGIGSNLSTSGAACNPAGGIFGGTLDEFRLWNVVRSCADIKANRLNELTGTEPGLITYFNFNNGNVNASNAGLTTLTDLATADGAQNGTLSTFALTGLTSNWSNGSGNGVSGTTPTPQPEIQVSGNSVPVLLGDNTPSLLDSTDFGTVDLVAGVNENTFMVENPGTAALLLSGTPRVVITGSADFSLSQDVLASVAAASQATFKISFNPSSAGIKTATVTLLSNDCDEAIYSFSIQGAGELGATALNFDGVNDYVLLPGDIALPSGLTYEAWVRTSASVTAGNGIANVGQTIIGDWKGSTYAALGIEGTKARYNHANASSVWIATEGATTVNDGNWHHIAVSHDHLTGDIKIYVDGILDGEGNVPYSTTFTKANILGAGYNLINTINGTLDEIRVWNGVRSCLQIRANRLNHLAGNEPGLLAYYSCNQAFIGLNNASFTTLVDVSTGTNDGTLTNFALTGLSSNYVDGTTNGVSGSTPATLPQPELELLGNGVSIRKNDATPSLSDSTDFGSVGLGVPNINTFVIQNTGPDPLNLSGAPIVAISGSSDFILQADAGSASVAGAGITSFQIRFLPSSVGVKTATVTILNDDCDEGQFTFTIQGTGAPAAAALDFDGINDHVRVLHSPLLNVTNHLTMEAWVYLKSYSHETILAKWDDDGNQRGYMMNMGETGDPTKLCVIFDQAGNWLTNHLQWNSGVTIPLNSWHHVAVTHDATLPSNNVKVYLDGVLSAQTNWAYPIFNTAANMMLGAYDSFGNGLNAGASDRYLNGRLDEVRVWNRTLCASEIQHRLTCEPINPLPGLVASYSFNQGANAVSNSGVTVLTDASGNGLNGTLGGFTLNTSTSNWIAPGGVVSGNACSAWLSPDIQVSGNSTQINKGDTSPSLTDHTDFGNVNINSGSLMRTFTIQNAGTASLQLTGSPRVSVTGTGFTLQSDATSTIAAGGTSTFTIVFDPSSAGVSSAVVSIASDDCDSNPFTFSIQGAGDNNGAALHFDGLDDQIQVGTNSVFNLQTGFTLEAWINLSNTVGKKRIFERSNATGWAFGIDNGGYLGGTDFGVVDFTASTLAVAPNTWTHVAYVVTASGVLEYYVNGVLAGTHAGLSLASYPVHPLKIGYSDYNAGESFAGMLDEVRIWNRALNACEINHHVSCEIQGASAGLLLNYHFNQGLAGTSNAAVNSVTDDSGSGHAGTLANFALAGALSNWVAPGAVPSGQACTAFSGGPSIAVTGNSINIVNGDNSPASGDFTDFGSVTQGNPLIRSFSIQNASSEILLLTGTPRVSVAGSTDFKVSTQASATVAASGSTTFSIQFNPATASVQNAVVTIESNDCNDPVFTFTISGTGVVPTGQEIGIRVNTIPVASNGSVTVPSAIQSKSGTPLVIQIENTGTSTLSLTGATRILLGGTHASEFTLDTSLVTNAISAGSSISFSITATPAQLGTRTATIVIQSNDADEATYVLNIQTTGLIAGDVNKNGVIDGTELAGDVNENGIIDQPSEILGDINGNASIDYPLEILGDKNGNRSIDVPLEVAGDENGNGTITAATEIIGDVNGNGAIDYPSEVFGDINGNGLIDLPDEIAGDGNGSGTITAGEITGDVNGNGVLDPFEIAGDINGNGQIDAPSEILGDVNGNGTIDVPSELTGDRNGDGVITFPSELLGDKNGNGQIDVPTEILGDINGDGIINVPSEITGDKNGNGLIDLPAELLGDRNGNGTLDVPSEILGDINGDGAITFPGEVTGDRTGDGNVTFPAELLGDMNGNGRIDVPLEKAGDINGNGLIDVPGEMAGNTDTSVVISYPAEVTGDINGNGRISQGEVTGDINGDGSINGAEIWGDFNGDGSLSAAERTAFYSVPYYIYGVTPINTERVERYRVSPDTLTNMEYRWTYSSPSLDIITVDTLNYLDVFATAEATSGTFTCYLSKEKYPFDTLYFNLVINIQKSVDVGEVINTTEACVAQDASNQCQGVYINYFKLKELENDSSGCQLGGMQDFTKTSMIADLEMGGVYSAVVKPSGILRDVFNNPLPMYYAIWIDYNNDGAFDGPNEFVITGDSKQESVALNNITIANDKTYQGQRRLRLAMRSSGGFSSLDACDAQGFGENSEREDYLVNIIPVADLQGPNLFTPNNDGLNDLFVVKGLDPLHVNKTRVRVFTQEGKIVFDSGKDNDYANNWAGTDEKGEKLPKGIYYYHIAYGEGDQYLEVKSFIDIQY